MKFAVGYQLAEQDEESFVSIVRDYREHIAEVYFPWGQMASGRASLTNRRGYVDWDGQRRMETDLRELVEMGISLDLLFNANCYGQHAVSEYLENQVLSVLGHLQDVCGGVQTVTTTSLAVARTVKHNAPDIEVRASVNMRIGTVQGMQYVQGLFDGYYVQRDFNRDLQRIGDLKEWADAHGKKLYPLVNSGCLAFCSGQTFHDNLVAHEQEINETRNIPGWTPMVCWNLLKDRANWPILLQATWIRPEDLHHYEGLFPRVKLATRMHAHPRMVIDAYVRRKFAGNLLDLFEPGYSPIVRPFVIDNSRFPADWFERSRQCGHASTYYKSVLEQVLVEILDEGPISSCI